MKKRALFRSSGDEKNKKKKRGERLGARRTFTKRKKKRGRVKKGSCVGEIGDKVLRGERKRQVKGSFYFYLNLDYTFTVMVIQSVPCLSVILTHFFSLLLGDFALILFLKVKLQNH